MTKAELFQPDTPIRQQDRWLPRILHAGQLQLDILQRDGCVDRKWLGFHPKEFEIVWRLAATPRIRVTRPQLLSDVWRLQHDPGTNRVEVNISRIRAKLHVFKLSWMVVTGENGGYWLNSDVVMQSPSDVVMDAQDTDDRPALDSYLLANNSDTTTE